MPSYFCTSPDVKKTAKKSVSGKGRQRISILLSGMLLVLVFVYIVQINLVATAGFAIKSLEKEVATLSSTEEDLQIKASALKEKITDKQSAEAMGFVAVDKTEYLGVNEAVSGVAIRQ